MKENHNSPSHSNSDPAVNSSDFSRDDELNESLANFARKYNLTTQNVKNIIYHIVKNPQTFSTLICNNPDALDIRITRARLKEIGRLCHKNIVIELKPVSLPKTFLDYTYEDDDEEDQDYDPNTDIQNVENYSCDLPCFSANANNKDIDSNRYETAPESDIDDFQGPLLLSDVDDPDYLQFVNSCLAIDGPDLNLFPDEDDDEFNVAEELDRLLSNGDENLEEYRMDKSTKIPRWEIESILEDFQRSEQDISTKKRKLSKPSHQLNKATEDNSHPIDIHAPQSPNNDIEIEKIANNNNDNSSVRTLNDERMNSINSSSLLSENVQFTPDQLSLIKLHMEKHVQLLCQSIVSTHNQAESFIASYNAAQKMLHELYDIASEKSASENSIFNVQNLTPAVYSANDIFDCPRVNFNHPSGPNFNEIAPYISGEAMWVLAKSSALRYPELLPNYQSAPNADPNPVFLPSENILLSLGLFQLHHVKHSTHANPNGRYHILSSHFLPNKTVIQIKNHMKNTRNSSNPLHVLIRQAKTGRLNMEFCFDYGSTLQKSIPLEWPKEDQPPWLRAVSDMINEGLDVVTENEASCSATINDSRHEDNEIIVIEEVLPGNAVQNEDHEESYADASSENRGENNSSTAKNNISLLEEVDPNQTINPEPSDINLHSIADEVFTSHNPSSPTSKLQSPAKSISKSKRRQRMERGMQAVCNDSNSIQSISSVVEAVYADIKQRLFMHQEKFRRLQEAIISKNIDMTTKFKKIKEIIGQTHPQIVHLILAIAPEDELPVELMNDQNRLVYKRALRIVLQLQTYLKAYRGAETTRNSFKFLKDVIANIDSEEGLCTVLQRHFNRDDPMCVLLRRELFGGRSTEEVPDSAFETIVLDEHFSKNTDPEEPVFERLTVQYQPDKNEKMGLRVNHGRVTMEVNGKQKNVFIRCSPICQTSPNQSIDEVSHLVTGQEKWIHPF